MNTEVPRINPDRSVTRQLTAHKEQLKNKIIDANTELKNDILTSEKPRSCSVGNLSKKVAFDEKFTHTQARQRNLKKQRN